ncbi:nicotinate dehydrogenase large molybdopterin subunit [Clostridium pasteurianum DSM 525 = ATCC 6013]|uniref:Nicotinate dehydrogenase large molybdopterin subunit n=1 Tax=Clostridium pasteurianum DSM 525 = ATCC 6013 TaxID=1262449 RepID=A0A0H3J3A3_CLOPA|nr:xanthine dehydrogenase family protein molybdopterin-binding subunit [Clostridium pasteurianum]AJA46388.1 nicotinate dehydrogenase large molybdopterin subunit [Clostridium pasteurianum DSM 525 = ATCC 6013]AJA50376.1 nicotinate dehydrogenase large molybdopterin subunit [Clostridium pasteurianum DSM 525 = ATCC 6013]AOZ73825.1 xanthine dehydrogenase [Clostridium pasteurianum DSM 525 = ATCC 6013]AOZ77622.1 xanthine dehydrogenase [Clostridium pasteurianum]ELP60963.1 aerobic-type carbon monoxide d
MNDFNVIGKSVQKKDGIPKVTGKALFARDIKFESMLYAKVLRSKVAHALLKRVDTSKAEKLPGVAAVLTSKDIPGSNRIGIIMKDEPVLVDDKIRRYGDALAVVAAETEEIAEEALNLIEVEYDELPLVTNVYEALKEDSPKVHGDTNLLTTRTLIKGDVDEAFKKCDVIVEKIYKTNYYAHMFIEPEAGVSKYENGLLTIWASTQNPHFDRGEVARVLGLPQSKVRVVQAETGGGFGGKLDISTQCFLGLLTYHTKKPVKLAYTREESMEVSSKRHPHIMKYKTGADKNGKLIAMEAEFIEDSGAYASYAPAVITRAVVHSTGPYEIPNVRVRASMVYTNNPMAGAFRGFGVPQVSIAHEQQMDMLAEKLNMIPYDIRIINALRVGSYTCTMQKLEDSIGVVETLEKAREKAEEVILNSTCELSSRKRRGVGIGCMWYGIGNTGLPNPASAFLEMHKDGSVTVMAGCADIGQGSNTVMCQIVAETLGVNYEEVNIISADTGSTPDGGATSASRQTYISGNACKKAAEMAKESLMQVAEELLNSPKEDIILKNKRAYVKGHEDNNVSLQEILSRCAAKGIMIVGSGYFNPNTTGLDPHTMQGVPFATYAFATHFIEVEVDIYTGEVKVLKVIAAHDVGKAINRKMVEGQIEGGCLMGMGLGILENLQVENAKMKTLNFSNYLIYTAKDIPEIYPIIVESEESTGPFGAKGVGEPALIPVAPAILNAVHNAIGVRFTEIPLTLEKVVEGLNNKFN